jgi:hypothetical protein
MEAVRAVEGIPSSDSRRQSIRTEPELAKGASFSILSKSAAALRCCPTWRNKSAAIIGKILGIAVRG